MPVPPHHQPSLGDVYRIVLRHRRKVLTFVTLTLMLTVLAVLSLPRKYRSEAKLLVLVGRESVSLDPIVTTSSKTLSVDASRETEINTLLELLRCRSVLSKVVDKVGAETLLKGPEKAGILDRGKQFLSDAKARLKYQLKSWSGQLDTAEGDAKAGRQEDAIKMLSECLTVSSAKNSTIVTVAGEAHSPALAQTMVASLVDVYTHEHMKLHSTAGSEDFFRGQKELIDGQLSEKRATLSELRSQLGIGSVEAEYERLEDEKASIASLRSSLTRDLAGTVAKCEALRLAVASAEEVVLTERSEGKANGATDSLRTKLYELEMAESRASQTYTDAHPELKMVRSQLAIMRDRFAAEQADRTETMFGRNVARESMLLELQQEQTRAAELQAQITAAESQWDLVLASLAGLNESAGKLDQLVQDVNFLERSYDSYSDSLEQSRIGGSLTQRQISNMNIAQPASFVSEPIKSNRMLLATAGLVAAILGAIPFALVLEYLDCRLKSPDEVEAFTGVPVLVALPRESHPLQLPEHTNSAQNVG